MNGRVHISCSGKAEQKQNLDAGRLEWKRGVCSPPLEPMFVRAHGLVKGRPPRSMRMRVMRVGIVRM
jgi:hypothetical protein